MVNVMRKLIIWVGLLFVCVSLPAFSNDSDESLSIESVTNSFSAKVGQTADINFKLSKSGTVEVEILEPDGNVIRSLSSEKVLDLGKHALTWDGRDLAGNLVPDEVYTVRINLKDKDGKATDLIEPSIGTGGELLEVSNIELAETHVGFRLPESARVLVRIGVKDGPMLRNLMRWKPRTAGKNRLAWDGFDASGVIDLRRDPNTTVLVVAYKLPEHSIVTYGNESLSYISWFESLNLTPKTIAPEAQELTRGENRIAREYYRSLYHDEVGFYVDGVFVSEEEQGYLPMSWRLNSSEYSSGEHALTVNISGFDGRVGVASTLFTIDVD